jgi:hypothetical protein
MTAIDVDATGNGKKGQGPTAEQRKLLESNGVHITWGELTKNQYGLREIARIADFSEQWLRSELKAAKIPSTRDEKGRYQVSKATLELLRAEHAKKQLARIERLQTGKKYAYKRPSQFAFDMVSKKVTEDTTLTPEQKKLIKSRLDAYKVDWDKAFEVKKVKIAKKATEEAKPKVK